MYQDSAALDGSTHSYQNTLLLFARRNGRTFVRFGGFRTLRTLVL